MSFHLQDKPRLRSAVFNTPLILSWAAGILLGLSYLAMPGYLFWASLALFLFIIVLFRNYRYGYYLMVLILPVDRTHLTFGLGDISGYRVWIFPYALLLCITLVVWLVSRTWNSERNDKTMPMGGLLLFMATYMVISLLWAPHFDLAFYLALSLILNFSVFFLTRAVIIDAVALRRAAIAWSGMGFITATGVILSNWYSYTYTVWLSKRLYLDVNFGKISSRLAGLGGPDFVGGLLVSSIFITMGIFMTSKGLARKTFLFLLMVYQTVAMIETSSRGALIGFIAGLVLLFSIHPASKNKMLKHSFFSIFLLIVMILIAKPAYIDRILVGFGYTGELYFSDTQHVSSTTSQSSTDTGGLSSRVKWWKKAFKEMLNHPYKLILGLRVGGFITYSGAIYTHSVPLSFFFDLGLMGALIFTFLAIILFINFSRYLSHAQRTPSYYIFLASVVAFVAEVAVHGLIDYDFYSYAARMFWFPLSWVCAACNVVMAENPDL